AAGSAATTGNGSSIQPSLSADGRYLSFLSTSTDLVAGATPREGSYSLYLFDRIAGTAQLVAWTASGGGSEETTPAEQRISADGGWVAFTSYGDDLVPGMHQNIYT